MIHSWLVKLTWIARAIWWQHLKRCSKSGRVLCGLKASRRVSTSSEHCFFPPPRYVYWQFKPLQNCFVFVYCCLSVRFSLCLYSLHYHCSSHLHMEIWKCPPCFVFFFRFVLKLAVKAPLTTSHPMNLFFLIIFLLNLEYSTVNNLCVRCRTYSVWKHGCHYWKRKGIAKKICRRIEFIFKNEKKAIKIILSSILSPS